MLNLTRNLSTWELLESVYKRALRYRFSLGKCFLCGLPVEVRAQLCRGCVTDLLGLTKRVRAVPDLSLRALSAGGAWEPHRLTNKQLQHSIIAIRWTAW